MHSTFSAFYPPICCQVYAKSGHKMSLMSLIVTPRSVSSNNNNTNTNTHNTCSRNWHHKSTPFFWWRFLVRVPWKSGTGFNWKQIPAPVNTVLHRVFPPTLIIFGTKFLAFYVVVRWHKLCEVENECTLHNSIVLAIFVPKISKLIEI